MIISLSFWWLRSTEARKKAPKKKKKNLASDLILECVDDFGWICVLAAGAVTTEKSQYPVVVTMRVHKLINIQNACHVHVQKRDALER